MRNSAESVSLRLTSVPRLYGRNCENLRVAKWCIRRGLKTPTAVVQLNVRGEPIELRDLIQGLRNKLLPIRLWTPIKLIVDLALYAACRWRLLHFQDNPSPLLNPQAILLLFELALQRSADRPGLEL